MSEVDSKPEASKPWVPPHLRRRSDAAAAVGLNTSDNPRFRTYSSRMIAARFGNPNDGTLTPDTQSPDRLSRILIFEGQHPEWPSKIFLKTNLQLLNKPSATTTTSTTTDTAKEARDVEEKKPTTGADDDVETKREEDDENHEAPTRTWRKRRDSKLGITITDEMQDYLSHGAQIPLFTQQIFPSSGGGGSRKNWGGKSDDTKFDFTGWYTVENVQVLRKGSQELIDMLGEKWYQSGRKRPDEIGEGGGGGSGGSGSSGSRSGHAGGYGKWRRGRRGSTSGGYRDKYSQRRRGSDEPSKDDDADVATVKDEASINAPPAAGNTPAVVTTTERNLPVPSEGGPSSSTTTKEEVGPLREEKDITLTENDKPTQAKGNNEGSQPEDSAASVGTGTSTGTGSVTGTGNGIGVAMTTDNTINGPRDPAVMHKHTQRLEDTKYRTESAWRRSLGVDWAVVTLKKSEDRTDNPMDGFDYVDNEPEEVNKKDRRKYTRKNEALRNEDGSDESPVEKKKPVAADPQPDMPQSPADDTLVKKNTSGTMPIDDYLTGKYGTVKRLKEFTSPTATTTTQPPPPPPEDLASSVSSLTPSQSASKVLGVDDSPTVLEFVNDNNNPSSSTGPKQKQQKQQRKYDNDDNDDDTDYQTYGTEKLIEHRTPRPTIISPIFSKRKDSAKESAVTSPVGGGGEFGEDSLVDDFSAVGLSSDADTSIIDAGRDDEEESECWSELSNSVTTFDKNWTVIDRE